MTSSPKSEKAMLLSSTDTSQVHAEVTGVAPVLASGVDIKTAGANVQNLVVSSHNSHAEAQGWGAGLVPKPELQAWERAPSQRIEPNNPATVPAQTPSYDHLGDASSIQNSASFSTGNPTGNSPSPGFPGTTTPQPWRPPTSSNQSNITAPAPSNIPWGMIVAENQNAGSAVPGNSNISCGGPLPANVNMNWMPAQVPAPGNANPGWTVPSQGPPPVNAVGWGAPGQGYTHANAAWVVPGQGPTSGSANPSWAASAGNPSTWEVNRVIMESGSQTKENVVLMLEILVTKQVNLATGSLHLAVEEEEGILRGLPLVGKKEYSSKFHESGHCKKGASCDFWHTF